ncbi:hypothetical protein FBU30_009880 [Linnemannia zychae]|nr:hypothetical protein FBU30_009880 [Linnemannia zychae]
MNYAEAIKRSPQEVAATRAAARAAALLAIRAKTIADQVPVPPPPIQTTACSRSGSRMSDCSDSESTVSSPSSAVSTNSSTDSISQLPFRQRLDRDSNVDSHVAFEKSSLITKERSLESNRRASRKKNQKRREAAKRNKTLFNASNGSKLLSSLEGLIDNDHITTQQTQVRNQSYMSDTSSYSLPTSPSQSSSSFTDESSLSPYTIATTSTTEHENEIDKHSMAENITGNFEQEATKEQPIVSLSASQEQEQHEAIASTTSLHEQELNVNDSNAAIGHDTLSTMIGDMKLDVGSETEAATSTPFVINHNDWDTSLTVSLSGVIEDIIENKDTIEDKDSNISTKAMRMTTSQGDQQSLPQISFESEHEPAEPITNVTPISSDHNSHNADFQDSISSWDIASERVATVALQCLTKDMDMELSYVAILSAITVLQSKEDQQPEYEDINVSPCAKVKSFRDTVASSYSQILDILCKSDIADKLGKETLRQGVMAPEELYAQFYGSIQQAGYDLHDVAHLSMAQYWTDRKKIEEAQECIHRIEPSRWANSVYRAAITCHLFAKPRQIQEAEGLLQKYIDIQDGTEKDAESKIMTWYKLQLDASKWEDIKAQYEKRRARLVDAPANTERVETESKLTPQALQQLQEQHRSSQHNYGHKRSVSIASSTTSSSHRRTMSGQLATHSTGHQRTPSSSSHQRTPSGALNWPSGASATLNISNPPPAKAGFSFMSSFKFGSKSTNVESKPSLATPTTLPSRIHVNRHLTVLDNNMLEECIAYREFEYGWKHVYERMGPTLEDGETAKIAMRLCRHAFLGHGGLSPNDPGSPNVVARDFSFKPTEQPSLTSNEDSELWEARAWVIYNKVTMGSGKFLSNSSSIGSAHGNTSGASTAGSASMSVSMFMHDILTIAIHSPEISSRYLKAFKVYTGMRNDTHYHQQLRDPFVMGLMLKAIYDAVLAVLTNPKQQLSKTLEHKDEVKTHHRRSSSLSLNRTQPMTLGPLIDLAFEIYADMRNVGPIRHLPSLVSLTPTSPINRHSRQGSLSRVSFNSSRSAVSQADIPSESTANSTVSISPRSSFTVLSMPVFQEVNPTLKANPQARRLAPELYLALLHFCIHVPVFRISSQVVKTIVHDMSAGSARQVPHLDIHLAAALQCYHDTWMCSTGGIHNEAHEHNSMERCDYHEWMYQSEETFQEHLSKTNRLSTQSMMSMASGTSGEGIEGVADELEKDLEEAQLAFGSGVKGETCNDQLYWDLWSMDDDALKNVQFSKKKAAMLWTHVSKVLL